MYREIEFRAKLIDNDCWTNGSLVLYPNGRAKIYSPKTFRDYWVNPNTIGQFTELTDKDGKKIYEGDIIYFPLLNKHYEVVFKYGQFEFNNRPVSFWKEDYIIEVVGNIYDNPELLKGGE